ncbi:MAG: hypothetical protein PT118_01825 [Aphanizomenon gracile PMC644.10]|nr:hypothetical protein [Aphanizomenon gracile PMC644.10]
MEARQGFNKDIELLNKFNELADKLKRKERFINALSDLKLKISFNSDGLVDKTEMEGPDRELIDGFVLLLRFFFITNEDTSLFNNKKKIDTIDTIYYKLPLSEELKERYKIINFELNTFLDSESKLGYCGNDEREITRQEIHNFLYGKSIYPLPNNDDIKYFTYSLPLFYDQSNSTDLLPNKLINRDIFDTFINGELVHQNRKEKVQKFKDWMSKDELWSNILWCEFIEIIVQFTEYVFQIQELNIKAIEELITNKK